MLGRRKITSHASFLRNVLGNNALKDEDINRERGSFVTQETRGPTQENSYGRVMMETPLRAGKQFVSTGAGKGRPRDGDLGVGRGMESINI